MKISTLIQKLNTALRRYGDIDVTVSETLWLYNTIKGVKYIKSPYSDSDDSVVELVDYVPQKDEESYEIL